MALEAVIRVTSARTWRVLLSPVRVEVAEALRAGGPMSIAQLAAMLGRRADSLYRHVELLRKAGFVKHAGHRKAGRHVEQLFEAAARDFVLDLGAEEGPQADRAVVETARAFSKAAERAVRDAARAGALNLARADRNITINFEQSWLTPAKFRQVRNLIRQVKAIMDAGKAPRKGQMYMTLAIATPVVRQGRGRRGTKVESRRVPGASRPRSRPSRS